MTNNGDGLTALNHQSRTIIRNPGEECRLARSLGRVQHDIHGIWESPRQYGSAASNQDREPLASVYPCRDLIATGGINPIPVIEQIDRDGHLIRRIDLLLCDQYRRFTCSRQLPELDDENRVRWQLEALEIADVDRYRALPFFHIGQLRATRTQHTDQGQPCRQRFARLYKAP